MKVGSYPVFKPLIKLVNIRIHRCFYPFKYENILEIFTPVNKKISVKFGKQMVFSSILKYCSVGFILEGINLINY